jgi:hypothetical protein
MVVFSGDVFCLVGFALITKTSRGEGCGIAIVVATRGFLLEFLL